MESTVVEITPDILARAKKALQIHYARELKINYLFYDLAPIPIDQAPQLVLIKEEEQKEKERSALEGRRKTDEKATDEEVGSYKKIEWRDERLASFEDLHKPKEPVEIQKLFILKNKKNQSAKRFLIVGRAGIGKTTLSKYITCKYTKLWGEKFEWVFYIPIRNLKETYGKRNKKDELKLDLAKVISCECFPDYEEISERQITGFLKSDKVLLILDGYDELNSTIPESALTELLNYEHVVLTSRPYALPDWRTYDYIQLENMGFSNEAINEYAQKFFTAVEHPDYTQSFLQFLRQNPSAWGIAHIPINLELICSLWEEKRTTHQEIITPFFLTSLYQDIVQKLFRRFLIKRDPRPIDDAKKDINKWSHERVYQETSTIVNFLEELAFRAIQLSEGNIIISNQDVIKPLLAEFRSTDPDFFEEILASQLIKGVGSQVILVDEDCYFIHLTFQEFFAASAIARRLKQTCALTSISENYEHIRQLILMHRYNPRFQLVWQFLAGLLADDVPMLKRFFDILRTEPQDLLGNYSRYLLVHCLAECREPKELRLNRNQLLHSLLIALRDEDVRLAVARALGKLGIATATPEVLNAFLVMLQDKEWRVRYAVADALGNMGAAAATHEVLSALEIVLQDREEDVRKSAVCALGNMGAAAATEEVLTALVSMLRDEDWNVRSAADDALTKLGATAATEKVLTALVSMLRDEDWNVRSAADDALTKLGATAATEEVLIALVNALQDGDEHVRSAAADALGKLGATAATEEVLIASVSALRDESERVRSAATRALGSLGTAAATEEVLTALVNALRDEDCKVRFAAAYALRNLGAAAVTEEVLVELVNMLRDENNDVRSNAADILKNLGAAAVTEEVLVELVNMLRDENNDVRSNAADILRNLGAAAATEEVLTALVSALRDEDCKVRFAAAYALRNLGAAAVTEEVLTVLVSMLRDKDWNVRFAAADTLGKLGAAAATEKVLTALVSMLRDEDKHVRSTAADALGKLGAAAATKEVLTALVSALRDEDKHVRKATAEALGNLGTAAATEEVLMALVSALQDENENVRAAAADTLGKLCAAGATEKVLIALVNTLRDEYYFVGSAAADTLGKLCAAGATEKVSTILVSMLQDENWSVRYAATRALEKLGAAAATEEVLTAVVSALQDEDWGVRSAAADTLGKLGAAVATEKVLTAVVSALQDENENVRSAAAYALGKLGVAVAATEEVLTVLVNMLRDENSNVRSAAIGALKKISIVHDTATFFHLLPQDVSSAETLYTAIATVLGYRFIKYQTALFYDSSSASTVLCCWEKGKLQRLDLPRTSRQLLVHQIQKIWQEQTHLPITAISHLEFTRLHDAATQGNTEELKRLLAESLADLDNQHNDKKFTPLMCALENAHGEATDILLGAGASVHLVSCTKQKSSDEVMKISSEEDVSKPQDEIKVITAIKLAAEYEDPTIRHKLLETLLYRRQRITFDEFEDWLNRYSSILDNATSEETAEGQDLLNIELGQLTAMGDMAKLFSKYSLLYRAHHENILQKIIGELDVENWQEQKSCSTCLENIAPDIFFSMQTCLYIALLMKTTNEEKSEEILPYDKFALLAWLKSECLLILETLYVYQELALINHLYNIEKLDKTQYESLLNAMAHNMAQKISALQEGECYEFMTGFITGPFTGHTAYVLFTQKKNHLIAQIHNQDDKGDKLHHERDKTYPNRLYPYFRGEWQQNGTPTPKFITITKDLTTTIQDLLRAAFSDKSEAIPLLYPTALNHPALQQKQIEKHSWSHWPAQRIENCVAWNRNVGIFHRLLQCHKQAPEKAKVLYIWLLKEEMKLIAPYCWEQGQTMPFISDICDGINHCAVNGKEIQTKVGISLAKKPGLLAAAPWVAVKPLVRTISFPLTTQPAAACIEITSTVDVKHEAALTLPAPIDESQQIATVAILARKEESFYLRLRNAFEQWDIQTAKKLSLADKKIGSSAKAMQKQAQRFGYQCVDVKRDGRCFYYAFIRQLHKINPERYQAIQADQEGVLQVIHRVAQHIIENQERYEAVLQAEHHTDLNGFIDKMLNNTGSLWADNIIILAAARIFNINITIIHNDRDCPTIFRRRDAEGTVYLGHEVEIHYQSLEHDSTIEAEEDLNQHIERADFDEWMSEEEAVDEVRIEAIAVVRAPGAIGLLPPPAPAAKGAVAKGRALFTVIDEEADAIQAAIQANARDLNIDLRPQLGAPGAPGFMPPTPAAAKGEVGKGAAPAPVAR